MANPQPGWYPDGTGLRWWDGTQWGPTAPGPTGAGIPPPVDGAVGSDESDKVLAILAHAGVFAGGFILPLVLYLVVRDRKGSLARHHAAEALNFQLTFVAMIIVAVVVGVGAAVAQAESDSVPWVFIVIWLVAMGGMVANFVLSIIGMVRAASLERWRYPINIRLIGRT